MGTPAHEHGPTDVALLDDTIPANLARTIAEHGANEALVSCHQDLRWSYDDFGERVRRLAGNLHDAGLRKGDRVGLWAPNYAEWTLVQYATAELGVILVNVNPAYRTHELAYALNQSGCRWVIASPEFKTSNYVDMVAAVRDECPTLERAVFFWTDEWDELVGGSPSVEAGELDAIRAGLGPDEPINIQYTSGTTGFPKGATLTHRNILNNGYFTTELQGITDQDRICIPVPFYHCFGMVMGNLGCTSHGATMVIPGDAFEPQAVLDAVQAERCTSLYGVPTMFIAELGHPDFASYDLSSLRTGVMAGSPCPVEVMKQCVDQMNMHEVTICYGMTETSPVSTQTLLDDSLHHRTATVGRAHPHVEIRVADPETGETVGRDVAGEFCTRGYSVMTGYWNDDAKTAEAIDADGWMHTGDLAEMDADGYCRIVGRIKDMVIRGGENIYPREIEEFLYTHPDVEDVQVIGVPDVKYGEELMAWVKLRPGADPLTIDQVRDFCRGKIAHYKVPRYVKFVDDFPMTVTGKVRKVEMRDVSVSELGLDTAAATGNRVRGVPAHDPALAAQITAWYHDGGAPMVHELGLRITHAEPGRVHFVLPVVPRLVHGGGVLCGQAIMASMDTGMVFVMMSLDPDPDRNFTTVQLHTAFERAVPGDVGEVTFEAWSTKAGRTLTFGQIDLLLPDGDRAASATTTYLRL